MTKENGMFKNGKKYQKEGKNVNKFTKILSVEEFVGHSCIRNYIFL